MDAEAWDGLGEQQSILATKAHQETSGVMDKVCCLTGIGPTFCYSKASPSPSCFFRHAVDIYIIYLYANIKYTYKNIYIYIFYVLCVLSQCISRLKDKAWNHELHVGFHGFCGLWYAQFETKMQTSAVFILFGGGASDPNC